MGACGTVISEGDLQQQMEYIERVRALLESGGAKKPTAFVDTYGCQQNEADSERIRGMLRQMGYDFTTEEEAADVIVINTCAVRAHAEQRVLGNVGALTHTKRNNPKQIICLCGCMMQEEHMAEKIRTSFRHVDIVFGPHALWRFPELLHQKLTKGGRMFETAPSDGAIAEGLPVLRNKPPKAGVIIMQGCNNFCSYCIVPHVRGREHSRMPDQIIKEVEGLVQSGYRDIMLLGQNVNSYGKDLALSIDFSDLLRQLNAIEGDFILRFMTSHPKDASPRLFQTMAECEKVENHLHLPFQAGNDRVLQDMNRGYTRESYLELVRQAKQRIPDLVLTSDVIVGFPGETTEEFEDTLLVLKEVEFDALFTFIYSPREGTPASRKEDPMPKAQKQVNFQRLLDLQNEISARKHQAYVGRTLRVLVDGESGEETYQLSARTTGGRLVHLAGSRNLIGTFVTAKITSASTWALFGEIEETQR
jgi:tRNA-2-methylthio-N6-dimethylallyladenosine synthase